MPDGEIFTDIGGRFFKLIWTDLSLEDGLAGGNDRLMKKIRAVMEYKAPQLEAHMKQNAPWTDRTGNARQGLRAEAFAEDDNAGIVLYGQVPYQVWLELANNGQYAIIIPTLEEKGPEVMQSIEHILEEI